MRLFNVLLGLFLCQTSVFGQTVSPRSLCAVPPILAETSGLAITSTNTIWSHNDSGGEAALYAFDTTGKLLRTLSIQNAANVDWEDLTQDKQGNFYIGDFGNNTNSRTDLRIYKIPNPEQITGNTASAQVIQFTYADQRLFPPPPAAQNYDMEALIAFRDSLYLFSKNRTEPPTGYTKVYRLPATPGRYVAALVDSFYTGAGASSNNWITSAAISPDQKRMVLLSNDKVWIFSNFKESAFFSGNHTSVALPITQKESICFAGNQEVYISDELALGIIGGRLYALTLPNDPLVNATEEEATFLPGWYAYTSERVLHLVLQNAPTAKATIQITSSGGKTLTLLENKYLPATLKITLPADQFPPGVYIIKVNAGTRPFIRKVYVE
jgi:hypothetical protein